MSQEVDVRERPILFSDAMVRAIREGRKTQTRRVIKPQPKKPVTFMPLSTELVGEGSPPKGWWMRCPYGRPGDRLWVKEAAQLRSVGPAVGEFSLTYRADEFESGCEVREFMRPEGTGKFCATRWKPSIFMPRWASRITLEIVRVRVERIQEISDADALAEGVCGGAPENAFDSARSEYAELWNSLNAKRGFGWEKNPWVWVIDFKPEAR